jgi:betaine-homocysteine S-methyltransferase
VAAESDALVAADICNTNAFVADDPVTHAPVRTMFEEQVGWAVEAGVDFVIAETFSDFGEARLALEIIRESGLPAVVTMAIHREPVTRDGLTPEDCCKRLEDAGADVVGLNCARGPETMLPLLKPIREAVSCHLAALPVPYRTHSAEPTFQSLTDHDCGVVPHSRPFPIALDSLTCNRYEIAAFTTAARAIGADYFGVCCGAGPHHIRSMAEALGRTPPASAYSPDMSKHAFFGTDPAIPDEFKDFAKKL